MSESRSETDKLQRAIGIAAIAAMFAALAWIGRENYLTFHSLAELFSIIIAAAVFVIVWNVRHTIDNGYLEFLGISLLFVSTIDLAHMLAYSGMGVFPGYGSDLPTQLWISARALESLSLLIAPGFSSRRLKPFVVSAVYSFVTATVFLATFAWRIFPVCYAEGSGLTPFKVIAEYVICILYVLALLRLHANRIRFQRSTLLLLYGSILTSILSEFAFTKYASVYGNSNLIGHLLKIVSVLFVYKAIVETGFRRPYELLYRNLAESERKFRSAIESNMIGVVFADAITGQVTEANDEYLRIIGRTRSELAAGVINWKSITPDDLLDRKEDAITRWNRTGRNIASYETEFIRPDGSRVPVIIGAAFLDDGHRRGVAYVLDNTARKKAELALRESEELFRAIFTESSVGKAQADPYTRRLLQVNAALCRIVNYPEDELRELTFMDLHHPDDRQAAVDAFDSMVRGEIPGYREEKRYIRRDGSIVWVDVVTNLIRDSKGQPLRSITIVQDITPRKQAEEALQNLNAELEERIAQRTAEVVEAAEKIQAERKRFLDVLDSLPVMIMLIRPDYQVPFSNRAFRDAMGESGGRKCYEYQFGRTAPCEDCQTFVPLRTIEPHNWQWELPTGRIFDIYSAPFVDADGARMILEMDIDITDRRHAEEELEQYRHRLEELVNTRTQQLEAENAVRRKAEEQLKSLNELLEKRVEERTAELEHRSRQLRQLATDLTLSEQRERQRLAMVLHDGLQQTLVAAKFSLAVLERGGNVKEQAAEASGLIDDSINISRSLTAELSPPVLYKGGLVPALEWLARWMYDKHGLAVKLTSQEPVRSIPEEINVLLFQSARELLFNVVKHAGVKEAQMEVQQNQGCLEVIVSDNGSGFEVENLHSRMDRATGMGLFSIRERLGYLGGRMEIESRTGRGSRFRLIAPSVPAAQQSTARQAQPGVSILMTTPSAGEEDAKKIRIVLVDDHMVMRQGLAGLLQTEPDLAVVGEASDGVSAVKLIRKTRPDVVLMDINMPGLDGIQVTRIIKREIPEIKIIGLSMFSEGEQAAAIREAGAMDYLTKSGPSGAVVDSIRKCMGITAESKPQPNGHKDSGALSAVRATE